MKRGKVSSNQSFEENFSREFQEGSREVEMDLNLVTKFKYYSKRLDTTLITEQSMQESISGFTLSAKPADKFRKLDYNEVFNEGIWRKVGSRTIHYIGNEALRVQIQSLKVRTSKSEQKRAYVDNYLKAMENVGYNAQSIREVEKKFKATSIDKLNILIRKGILPSINFLYISQREIETLTAEDIADIEMDNVDAITNALARGVSQKEVDRIRKLAKDLRENIKDRYKIRKELDKLKERAPKTGVRIVKAKIHKGKKKRKPRK